jgi:hypothetical protein
MRGLRIDCLLQASSYVRFVGFNTLEDVLAVHEFKFSVARVTGGGVQISCGQGHGSVCV